MRIKSSLSVSSEGSVVDKESAYPADTVSNAVQTRLQPDGHMQYSRTQCHLIASNRMHDLNASTNNARNMTTPTNIMGTSTLTSSPSMQPNSNGRHVEEANTSESTKRSSSNGNFENHESRAHEESRSLRDAANSTSHLDAALPTLSSLPMQPQNLNALDPSLQLQYKQYFPHQNQNGANITNGFSESKDPHNVLHNQPNFLLQQQAHPMHGLDTTQQSMLHMMHQQHLNYQPTQRQHVLHPQQVSVIHQQLSQQRQLMNGTTLRSIPNAVLSSLSNGNGITSPARVNRNAASLSTAASQQAIYPSNGTSLFQRTDGAALLQRDSSSPNSISTVSQASGQTYHVNLSSEEKELRISSLSMQANSLQSRSKFADAINLLNQLLFLSPDNVSALIAKGTCYKAMKDHVSAMECFQCALAMNPTNWHTHYQLGLIYKESDLFLEKSMEHFKLAIKFGPQDCLAWEQMAMLLTDLGTRLKLAGNTEKAIASYNEALMYDANYRPAHFNLGVIFSERGQLDKALRQYQLAIEHNPGYVEALCNIGVIYKNSGHLAMAIDYYERALRANPNFSIAINNLAIALTDMGTMVKNAGQLDEGILYYKRALAYNHKYPAAWYNLGVAFAEKNLHDDPKICYEMAILFDPKCAEAFNNLGVIYKDRGNLDQAIYYYQEALKANPQFSQSCTAITLNNLGVIYTMLGKLDEAYEHCINAIRSNPNYGEAYNNLGVLYRDEGRIEDAIAAYEECLRIDPLSRNAGQNRLLALNSVCRPDMTDEQVRDFIWEAHRQWGLQFQKIYEANRYTSWDNILTSDRILRIGYLSADFFTHSVSYFIEAPLRFADPTRTHVICYSNVARRDKKTAHLQSLAHSWRNVHDMSTRDVAELIRKDKVDILVELTGHTAGNRLDVLALKPAPIQVTWIGYPNTTGLPTIDYRFTDDIVDPVDSQQQYSETLVRLPGPFLCYTPPTEAPGVTDTPALSRGFVTFGSFNNLAKVNDRVLHCWCSVLSRVPNSRMLLKCKPFVSPTICSKILSRFNDFGIASERVDLVCLQPTTAEHLEMYSLVDLSLDTFPYAGTTTTCESLYMGVPVLTYCKRIRFHAHNVGSSLMSRIEGLGCLIADSMENYITKAVDLASDLNRLNRLRASIRPNMLKSAVCNGKEFTRNLEDVYHSIWSSFLSKSEEDPAKHTP